MNVTRKQQRVIQRALDEWQAAGALSHAENQRLAATLRVSAFDWQRLSRYAFWTALACLLIALGSVLADSELIAWLVSLFSDSALARIALPAAVALVCYLWGFRRQRRAAYWHYSTEAILFCRRGVYRAGAGGSSASGWDDGSGHIAPLFLVGCAIYGAIGLAARSGLVWLFFLLALGNWFGAETGYVSGWGGLLAGHELSDSFCAVWRRAAGALFYAAKVAASSAGCLPSVRPWA
ncbi:Uncharacterised protein [Raoultella planticola]|uniref:DUF2157 domain-containing protein n=1 Tax=Raoultella planticola TaxID=575 RepID=A0A485DCH8_RAOPL|nr:Uncharacterised protein [Raoultella planticola]